MKIFETERLTIRTLDENDIDRLVEYRSKKTVSQYQSWNRYTKRDAVKLIKKCKDTVIEHKKRVYAVWYYNQREPASYW